MRLEGQIALVTGAASGYGAEIARRFAREGAKVVLMDLNAEGAKKVASEASDEAVAVGGDVTKRSDIDAAVKLATDKFDRLDIVVNNAGWTYRNKPLLELTESEFDKVFNVNVEVHLPHDECDCPVNEEAGRRVCYQYRFDRRHSPPSGSHLV
jgi:3-oxoacyl-[acyl-carrier protein] reductase